MADEAPVVSQKEALLEQQTGSLATGQRAPGAVVVDTNTPAPQGPPQPAAAPPGPKTDEEFWGGGGQDPQAADDAFWGGPAQAPEQPKPKKGPQQPQGKTLTDRLTTLAKGAGGFGLDTAQFLNMAGATPAMLVDKVHSIATGVEQTGAQDQYFSHFVDPIAAARQQTDLDPGADFTDKLLHGIGATAAMIGAALLTGGAAVAPEGAAATIMGRAATGVGQMTAPAAVAGIDTGKRVYEATGDAKAAAVAGSASYTLNALSGAVPMAVGKGIPTRMATGAAIGPVLGEAQRQVQNATMPEDMQQPFDKEDSLAQVVTGSLFGLMPGGHAPREVREAPHTVMDHAVQAAVEAVKADGGDNLDQVVAATNVNADIGAHHDAALYEGSMQENRNEAARQEAEVLAQHEEQFGVAHDTEQAFNERGQQQEAAKDEDYTKALNQKGEQEIEQAQGAEKGTEGATAPTLADTLKPEERVAFDSLKARRAAEMSPEAAQETPADEKFMPYVEPKGGENVREPVNSEEKTPPITGKTTASQREEMGFSPSPETEPLVNPPPKTLAERREAAQAGARMGNPEDEAFWNEGGAEPPEEAQERPAGEEPQPGAEEPPAEPKANAPERDRPTTIFRGTETGEGGLSRESSDGEMGRGVYGTKERWLAATYGGGPKAKEGAGRQVHEISLPELPPEQYGYIHGGAKEGEMAQLQDHEGNVLHEFDATKKQGAASRAELRQKAEAAGMKVLVGTKGSIGENQVSVLDKSIIGKKESLPVDIKQGGGARPKPQPQDPETGQFRPLTLRERREASMAKRGADFNAEPAGLQRDREAVQKLKGSDTANKIWPKKAPKGWEATEGETRPRVTKEQAETHMKPLLAKVGPERMQVHDDHTTLPQSTLDAAASRKINPASIRGVYSPDTDTVHIVAGAHRDPEQALRTAVHEIVGHQGIQKLLGDDYEKTMQQMHRDIHTGPLPEGFRQGRTGGAASTPKEWMRDYMNQHNFDPRDKGLQAKTMGEYIAHLAEHDVGDRNQENPTVLRKAIDAVRSGLRKVGLVREWNDSDIRALLRKSANNLESEHALSAKAYRGDGPDFATDEDHEVEQLDSANPLSQAHKLGRTMEDQANYNPGFIKSRLDWAKNALAGEGVDKRLAFIGLRNLPDFMNPKLMPSLRSFIRQHDQMQGRKGRLMDDANNKLLDWSKWGSKNKEGAKDLGEIMHASTLAGVDPSKPFQKRWGDTTDATKVAHDAMRKDVHAQLKKVYDRLDTKGKELYNTVREHYAAQRENTFKALEQRVAESGADEQSKKQLMTSLRQQYENGRVQAPYFPLQRFGDRWASAKDKDGNTVSFSRFESKAEQGQWQKEMANRGYAIDGGQRMDSKSEMERISPKFVQKVMGLAKEVDPELAHDIWQEYLKAMPEMSMRKHFIGRVGRLGYSMDAMRAFSYNSFHGAHQLARLEYGHRLDTTLDSIKSEAQKVTSDAASNPNDSLLQKNAEWAPALAREMERRYDWIKNPRSSPLASALTKFGFGWYLGAAPATAFRIFSQNPMLAQPTLAKYHGQLGATKELSRASAQWAMSRGDLGDTLRGDERKAFDTAKDMGVFSSTATQNLASGGSGDPVTGPGATALKAMGYMFNAMEHHNRMTTYLAGYRLGKQQGMSHSEAVDHATDVTWDSHFDYTNANRPRVLQNDFMKVAGLFKQYSWGVTYRLAREARDMFDKELSPEQNVQARKAFAGLLGRGMMFAGVSGLPLSWIASSVVDAVMGDKDQPFDSEAALHAHLTQAIGRFGADSIMTGPVGAISGASLSGGASYNDLWYRPPTRNEKVEDTVKDAAMQAFGPIAAIGVNAAQGVQMIKDGDIERGFEHFMPPEGAALMKAYRYNQEGVTNLQGEPVLDRSQIDNRDLFLQSVGFTPQKVADMYAENSALKNVSQAIQQRREKLINRLSVVAGMDDGSETDKALADVEQFNDKNPGIAIQGKTIVTSMRNHFKQCRGSRQWCKVAARA